MAAPIRNGTVFIKNGTLFPEALTCECEPYLKRWRIIQDLDSNGLDRKLREAGWAFLYMADEVDAIAMGPNSEATRRRAAKKIMARMKSGGSNCAEVVKVAAKSFLGLPYVTVSAHARHIQESMFLTRPGRASEPVQVQLATAVSIQGD